MGLHLAFDQAVKRGPAGLPTSVDAPNNQSLRSHRSDQALYQGYTGTEPSPKRISNGALNVVLGFSTVRKVRLEPTRVAASGF